MNSGIILRNNWGDWGASWEGEKLVGLHLPGSLAEGSALVDLGKFPVLYRLSLQLERYLQGENVSFDIPYILRGTAFQVRVWQELMKIPYGQTRTYGEIAERTGGVNKARAVGGACNKNPLAIIIPCHRVVGRGGKLVGFGGGLGLKKKLLDLEGGNFHDY